MDKRHFKLGWCIVVVWLVVIIGMMVNYQSLEQRTVQIQKVSDKVDEFRSSLFFESAYRSNMRDQQVELLASLQQQRDQLAQHSAAGWLQPDIEQLLFTMDRFIEQSRALVNNELALSELLTEIQAKRLAYQSRPEIEVYYFQLSTYLFEALFSSSSTNSKAYKHLDELFIQSNSLVDADKITLQTMLAQTSRVMGSFAQGGYIVERLISNSVYKELQNVVQQSQAALKKMVLIGILFSGVVMLGLLGMMHMAIRSQSKENSTQELQRNDQINVENVEPVVGKQSANKDQAETIELEDSHSEQVMDAQPETLDLPMSQNTAPQRSVTAAPQIDFSVMMGCLGGDRESLCMLLEVFVNDHQDDSAEIARLQHQSPEEAIRRAHSLKGVGGNLGAYQLRDVAGRLETALAKDSEQVIPLLADLELCLNQAILEAKAFISGEPEHASINTDSIAS